MTGQALTAPDRAPTADHRYCRKCEDWTALIARGVCPWCDGPLTKTRRGGKRPGRKRSSRFTVPQLRLLYKLHIEKGLSVNELGRRTHRKLGYKSHFSAAAAISTGWRRLGLEQRDRIAQVKRTCTVHGNAPKHRTHEQERAYRRYLQQQRGWRAQQGPGQPQCQGVKRHPPRQGSRCQRPAQGGSDFCLQHDPARSLEVQATTARMRRRMPAREMLPIGPFGTWLAVMAQERGSLKAACTAYGWPYTAACQYVKGHGTNKEPKLEISRRTVARFAEAAGVDVDRVYEPARVAVAA